MELNIEVDQIDTVEKELEVIGDAIGFDFSKALLTDLSELSDFTLSGDKYPGAPRNVTYREVVKHWDEWVIQQLKSIGIELKSTKISLLVLAQMVSNKPLIH